MSSLTCRGTARPDVGFGRPGDTEWYFRGAKDLGPDQMASAARGHVWRRGVAQIAQIAQFVLGCSAPVTVLDENVVRFDVCGDEIKIGFVLFG